METIVIFCAVTFVILFTGIAIMLFKRLKALKTMQEEQKYIKICDDIFEFLRDPKREKLTLNGIRVTSKMDKDHVWHSFTNPSFSIDIMKAAAPFVEVSILKESLSYAFNINNTYYMYVGRFEKEEDRSVFNVELTRSVKHDTIIVYQKKTTIFN